MMQVYYKIVTDDSLFKSAYQIADISAIQPGTRFQARHPRTDGFYIQHRLPMIHFCDSPFDSMIWYNILTDGAAKRTCIYEITPITAIVKQKCYDSKGVYQCGANVIEFGNQIPLQTLVKLATQEFKDNWFKKITMYPKVHVLKSVLKWRSLIKEY